jgi:hypothetical protein
MNLDLVLNSCPPSNICTNRGNFKLWRLAWVRLLVVWLCATEAADGVARVVSLAGERWLGRFKYAFEVACVLSINS